MRRWSQDEISPFKQLKHFWMFTECSLKSGFQALFSDLSVSIQSHWTLLNGRHISVTVRIFFNFQEKKSQNHSAIKGFIVILLWITTHEINKKNGNKKHTYGHNCTRVFWFYLFLNRHFISTPLFYIGCGLIWIFICIYF